MNASVLRSLGWSISLLLMSSCSSADELPEGVRIVSGSHVDEMLNQCSRGAPMKGEGTWIPNASDIRAFEAAMAANLPAQLNRVSWLIPSERQTFRGFPSSFFREYIGIVRDRGRYIYGSFGPKRLVSGSSSDVSEGSTRVCDGGPVFFGAEYDVKSKDITHWGFNGPLG